MKIISVQLLVSLAAFGLGSDFRLLEISSQRFWKDGKPADHIIARFPRLDVDLFNHNSKASTLQLDYSVRSVSINDSKVNIGLTTSIKEGVVTTGTWINPSFKSGYLRASAYAYWLWNKDSSTAIFVPNARIGYEMGSAIVGAEYTCFASKSSWQQRLGPTVYFKLDQNHAIRLSALKGRGSSEVRFTWTARF